MKSISKDEHQAVDITGMTTMAEAWEAIVASKPAMVPEDMLPFLRQFFYSGAMAYMAVTNGIDMLEITEDAKTLMMANVLEEILGPVQKDCENCPNKEACPVAEGKPPAAGRCLH